MLDLRTVVDDLESVRTALALRSSEAAAALDPIAVLAAERRGVIAETERKAAARNAASKAMASADKASADFAERRAALKSLSAEVKELEQRQAAVERELEALLVRVPNLPDESTPRGASADDNPIVHVWGEPKPTGFEPSAHWDLGTRLRILDFERAGKLSGARFTVMRAAGARLERALIGFMMDLHADEHGYVEVVPPVLVKDTALQGTGQLPKFAADLFRIERTESAAGHDLYLSPTAEVQLTNLHAEEILEADELPIAYVAATACFRSEAGSHGQDVRGMIRQHQFDKVELVRIVRPETSAAELELLTRHAETVLERLGLHYRRVALCTGDLGF
jgi:seryl-tRNA synthetase